MTTVKSEKCAHPICSCLTSSGRYCSPQCEAMEQTPDIDCSCGHTGCEGNMRSTTPATLEASNPTQHRRSMKAIQLAFALLTLMASVTLTGCHASTASPEVSGDIRKSLDQAGLKDVSVSQDRAKGIVTLGGHVTRENDKAQAEFLARSYAGSQVVADQIAVIPAGIEREAKAMNADLDQGIEKNLDAALIQSKMHENVKYDVKSGVVTLTGDVNSQNKRDQAERVALRVPNVKQVVNDLQVKDQKASSLL